MRRGAMLAVVLAGAILFSTALAAPRPPSTQPEAPPPDPVDNIMGDYEGTYSFAKGEKVQAKVVAEGKGNYRVVVVLPFGKGGPEDRRLHLKGKQEGERVVLAGSMKPYVLNNVLVPVRDVGPLQWSGTIADERLVAEAKGGVGAGTLELKRVVKHSPTEGKKPPPGAIVLLPFEPGKPTRLDAWTHKRWKVLADGSVQVFKGGNKTVRKFGDVELHVEFRVPYMPTRRGQGRGNSGVYLQNRYEVQVLDSFGLKSKSNDCGGLYKVAAPKVNACLPPLSWQTYDITFRAPRLDEQGKVAGPAVITVLHNGVLIHEKVKVPRPTGGGAAGAAKVAPIFLQDHGNPVRYRNIWLVELKADATPSMAPTPPPDAEGFRLLFNGKDLAGWTAKPGGWHVADGVLAWKRGAGYLWTKEQFGDFVLDMEFKVDKGTNSGVFFRTANPRSPVQTGIEMQVLDSAGKQKVGKHDCGAIYDCLAPSKNTMKPPGEWNRVILTCKGNKIAVVLNGGQVIDMDLDRWTTARKNPDGSRNKFGTAYKDMPRKGHIGFQDHGRPVWFRNIRIKTLEQ